MDLRIILKICLLAVISSGAGVNGANVGAGLPDKKKTHKETMENTPNKEKNFNYEISDSKSDSNRKYERTNDASSTWHYVKKHLPTNNSSLGTVIYKSFYGDQRYNTRWRLNSSKKKSYRNGGASEGPYEEECPYTCLHPPTPEMNLWCQANGCITTSVGSGSSTNGRTYRPPSGIMDENDGDLTLRSYGSKKLKQKRCLNACKQPANVRIQRTCIGIGCQPEIPTKKTCPPNECDNPQNEEIEMVCVAMGCVPDLDPGQLCPGICENPDEESERPCLAVGCPPDEYCPDYCGNPSRVEVHQCLEMGCEPDPPPVVNCPPKCYESPIAFGFKVWCVQNGCP